MFGGIDCRGQQRGSQLDHLWLSYGILYIYIFLYTNGSCREPHLVQLKETNVVTKGVALSKSLVQACLTECPT